MTPSARSAASSSGERPSSSPSTVSVSAPRTGAARSATVGLLEAERLVEQQHRPVRGMGHLLHEAAGDEVRIVEHVVGVHHRGGGDAGVGEHRHRLVLGAGGAPRRDDLVQHRLVLGASRSGGEARVVEQIGAVEDRAQRLPHPRRADHHVDVVVRPERGAPVHVGRRAAEAVADPLRRRRVEVPAAHPGGADEHRHHLVHAHLDHLALAGALLLHVRRQDRHRAVRAGGGVAERPARAHRWAVRVAGRARTGRRRPGRACRSCGSRRTGPTARNP